MNQTSSSWLWGHPGLMLATLERVTHNLIGNGGAGSFLTRFARV